MTMDVQTLDELTRDRWALLVGVNTYIDPNFSRLKFCVNDVKGLAQTLTQLGYTVVCLHDEQTDQAYLPTRDNVEDALDRLCKTVRAEDLLFVHFACHGKMVDQRSVLITQDTRYSLMAKRALPVAEVEKYMRDSKAKKLVMSLDACHTGVDVGRDVTDLEFLHNVYDMATGFALIAASTSQQKAQEWQAKQHGVYTYYLLEGLQGKADRTRKGLITVRDLQEYVTDGLRRWAVQEGGLIQEPTVRLEGIGDMILADYRQKHAPIASLDAFNSNENSAFTIRAVGEIATPPVSPQCDLRLNRTQRQQLREALMLAFLEEDDLARMLDEELEVALNAVAGGKTYTQIVFNLVRWFESQGRLPDLICAARRVNPGNLDMKAFATNVGLADD